MKKKYLLILIIFLVIPFINVNAIFVDSMSFLKITKVTCGGIEGIPSKIPELVSTIIKIIQVVIPVVLVIMGSIDLIKGLPSSKDDEMKKGQQMFIKRLITAVFIFFIIAIVKFFISLISDSSTNTNVVDCIDCFISNNCTKEN